MLEGAGSVQIMTDPDLRGPKAFGSYESGSTTLPQTPILRFILKNKILRNKGSKKDFTW
jgi:hypothetical protein